MRQVCRSPIIRSPLSRTANSVVCSTPLQADWLAVPRYVLPAGRRVGMEPMNPTRETVWSVLMKNLIYPGMLGNVVFLMVAAHFQWGRTERSGFGSKVVFGALLATIFALSFVEIHRLKEGQRYGFVPFLCDLVEILVVIWSFALLGLFSANGEPNWAYLFFVLWFVPISEAIWDNATGGEVRFVRTNGPVTTKHRVISLVCHGLVAVACVGVGHLCLGSAQWAFLAGGPLIVTVLLLWIVSISRAK